MDSENNKEVTKEQRDKIKRRIEEVLSRILSDKYGAKIEIEFESLDEDKK